MPSCILKTLIGSSCSALVSACGPELKTLEAKQRWPIGNGREREARTAFAFLLDRVRVDNMPQPGAQLSPVHRNMVDLFLSRQAPP